ncbi:MAG: hypothetical protein ABIG35_18050 [Pseudomonadota bacterium]
MKNRNNSDSKLRGRKWIAAAIENLNPEEDYAEIWRLSTNYYISDFIMNLVYALGIPSFTQYPEGSAIMAITTEKAMRKPHDRANDTLRHFWVWFEYGPNDPRMQASLAHVNRTHAGLSKKVSAGTFSSRHVIYTTAWIGVFLHRLRISLGLNGYTDKQKIATQRYWAEICRQFWSEDGMVVDYPESFEKMLDVVEDYETQPWPMVTSGMVLTEAIINQFVDAWFPRSMRWVGRQIYLSLQRPSILKLMRSGRPNPIAKPLIRGGLKTFLWLQEHVIPDPKVSTPEKARMRYPRAAQHIDPPTANPAIQLSGVAGETNKNPSASGCPFHL